MFVSLKDKCAALGSELKTLALHGSLLLVVALLPERLHFRMFRALAWLHPLLLSVDSARAGLQGFMPDATVSPALAARRIALHQLVAYADFYLILFYGDRWFARNVVVDSSLLPADTHDKGPFFFTPHYGQGVWAMHYLKRQQMPLTRLHAPPPPQSPPGQRVAGRLARWRTRQLEKLTGVSSITVGNGGSVERMRARLCDERMPVLAMPDAPVAPQQRQIPVQLLDRPAAFAHGVMALAARENIPVYIYTMAIDPCSGQRHLCLQGPFMDCDSQRLAQSLADISTQAIRHDPYAWHLWPWLESFLRQTDIPPTEGA